MSGQSMIPFISLLPNPRKELSNVKSHLETIKALRKLVGLMIIVIEKVKLQDLEGFDPHVGDTACDARAVMIPQWMDAVRQSDKLEQFRQALIGSLEILSDQLLKQLVSKGSNYSGDEEELVKSEGTKELKKSVFAGVLKKKETIQMFASRIGFEVAVPSEQLLYLFQAYVLTLYKGDSDRLDEGALGKLLENSSRFAHELGKKYQQNLAAISVNFVIESARDLHLELLGDRLQREASFDVNGRSIVPCFLRMKVLWEVVRAAQRPVVVIAVQDNLKPFRLFYAWQDGRCVNVRGLKQLDAKEPCMVVRFNLTQQYLSRRQLKRGVSQYLKRNISGIENFLFLYMAAHPQYPKGIRSDSLSETSSQGASSQGSSETCSASTGRGEYSEGSSSEFHSDASSMVQEDYQTPEDEMSEMYNCIPYAEPAGSRDPFFSCPEGISRRSSDIEDEAAFDSLLDSEFFPQTCGEGNPQKEDEEVSEIGPNVLVGIDDEERRKLEVMAIKKGCSAQSAHPFFSALHIFCENVGHMDASLAREPHERSI
ncbi:MAG: hypothetical protein EBX40_01095 [Gammaproteobacteria bacterium]|nr:hypothetical protein [Gammaproteobacteria bacterium]